MYLTKQYLKELCERNRWSLSSRLEEQLLTDYNQKEYDNNPSPWTEQDLNQQVRKSINNN